MENNICEEKISISLYGTKEYMLVCNATIKNDLNKFPNLYLLYRQLNFTFSLDYNDLFMELDNKIYFLVIYADTPLSIWNFGIILIKKYSFMFDEDKKSLYFIHLKKYNINSNDNNGNKTNDKDIPKENNVNFWNEYKEYIFFGLIFIILIIGLILGYIF